jgi:hypothetical protein
MAFFGGCDSSFQEVVAPRFAWVVFGDENAVFRDCEHHEARGQRYL